MVPGQVVKDQDYAVPSPVYEEEYRLPRSWIYTTRVLTRVRRAATRGTTRSMTRTGAIAMPAATRRRGWRRCGSMIRNWTFPRTKTKTYVSTSQSLSLSVKGRFCYLKIQMLILKERGIEKYYPVIIVLLKRIKLITNGNDNSYE